VIALMSIYISRLHFYVAKIPRENEFCRGREIVFDHLIPCGGTANYIYGKRNVWRKCTNGRERSPSWPRVHQISRVNWHPGRLISSGDIVSPFLSVRS